MKISLGAGALLALVSASMPAHADLRYYYRHAQRYLTTLSPPNVADGSSYGVYAWDLTGNLALTYETKLVDLGLDSHTSFLLNGAVIGNSPFAYWSTFTDSTVEDLCDQVKAMPLGPWQCELNAQGHLCIAAGTDQPFVFETGGYPSNGPAPSGLFGTQTQTTKDYVLPEDYCQPGVDRMGTPRGGIRG